MFPAQDVYVFIAKRIRFAHDTYMSPLRKSLDLYEKKLHSTTSKALSTHVDLRTTHVDDKIYAPRL